tara:strand:- start:697 stop:1149 length:453 start_codon:yes stop_codon:yes gene_type:complete
MWYDKYAGFPYKHLGNDPEKGIDCLNLIRLVYREQKNIVIPYSTQDFCNIIDQDWYNKIETNPFTEFRNTRLGWKEITLSDTKPFDVAIMSIGSTNKINHCALLVEKNKLLQTMIDRKSWISPYGKYYKQYTLGVFRWEGVSDDFIFNIN